MLLVMEAGRDEVGGGAVNGKVAPRPRPLVWSLDQKNLSE